MKKLWLILSGITIGSSIPQSTSATAVNSTQNTVYVQGLAAVQMLITPQNGQPTTYSCINCDLSGIDISKTLFELKLEDESLIGLNPSAMPAVVNYAKQVQPYAAEYATAYNNATLQYKQEIASGTSPKIAANVYNAVLDPIVRNVFNNVPIINFLKNAQTIDLTNSILDGAIFSGLNVDTLILAQTGAVNDQFTLNGTFTNIDLSKATMLDASLSVTTNKLTASQASITSSAITLTQTGTNPVINFSTNPTAGVTDLSSSTLIGNFTNANFSNTALYSAIFSNNTFDLANFTGAGVGGANFANASFKGATFINLEGCLTQEARNGSVDCKELDFRAAKGLDQADFTNAIMPGLVLSNATVGHFEASGAHLENAHLDGANFNCNQSNPQCGSMFFGANLTNANLSGAKLQVADFREAILNGANFTNADLTGAGMDNANASTAVQANGANFQGAILINTAMSGLACAGANFTDAAFQNTNLSNANCSTPDGQPETLFNTSFMSSDLSGLVASNANFNKAYFYETSLANAKLINCSFQNAGFDGVDLSGANLENSDLSGAGIGAGISLTPSSNFHGTKCNSNEATSSITAARSFPVWIAHEMSTDIWGAYIAAQCQANSQVFCGAFCNMTSPGYTNRSYDACHTFSIYGIDVGWRCTGAAPDQMDNSNATSYCGMKCCRHFVFNHNMNTSDYEQDSYVISQSNPGAQNI